MDLPRKPWSPWSWLLLAVLLAITLAASWCYGPSTADVISEWSF